eukprot:scaffold23116_cov23-Tisochrysis_lutea.AAC.1
MDDVAPTDELSFSQEDVTGLLKEVRPATEPAARPSARTLGGGKPGRERVWERGGGVWGVRGRLREGMERDKEKDREKEGEMDRGSEREIEWEYVEKRREDH